MKLPLLQLVQDDSLRCAVQAKKKAQQEKAAGKAGAKRTQPSTSVPAQPSTSRQDSVPDSSDSEEEEEPERFSLKDSRFASLVDDAASSQGPELLEGALSLGQGSQLAAPSSTQETATGSNAAESDDELGGESYLGACLVCTCKSQSGDTASPHVSESSQAQKLGGDNLYAQYVASNNDVQLHLFSHHCTMLPAT